MSKTFKNVVFVISFLGITTPLFSQNQNTSSIKNCFLCIDNAHIKETPYPLNFKAELPYLITGAGLLTTGFILYKTDNTVPYTVDELNALDRNDINSFDRGATYNWDVQANTTSDVLAYSSLVLPAIFLIDRNTREDIFPLIVMTVEVASINYGITQMVKSLVNRTRPYAYNTDAGLTYEQRTDEDSRFSYFSGHTSVTASFSFFTAKVLTDYHSDMKTGWKIGIWSFAATLPAATAYYRVKAGQHYNTDVISGYAIGAFTGWFVPYLHKKQKLSSKWSFYPTRVFNVQGVGVTCKF